MEIEALSRNFRDVMLELRVQGKLVTSVFFFRGSHQNFKDRSVVMEYVSAMMNDKRMRLIVIPTPLGSCPVRRVPMRGVLQRDC